MSERTYEQRASASGNCIVELTVSLNFTRFARLLLSRHLALRARCRGQFWSAHKDSDDAGNSSDDIEDEMKKEEKFNDPHVLLPDANGKLTLTLAKYVPKTRKYYKAILSSINENMDLKNFSTSYWCEERPAFTDKLKWSFNWLIENEGTECGGVYQYGNDNKWNEVALPNYSPSFHFSTFVPLLSFVCRVRIHPFRTPSNVAFRLAS